MGLFDKLKQKEQVPAPIITATGTKIDTKGILKAKKDEQSISTILMAQNRASRRAFARQYGMMLPGSTRPFINKRKKK